MKWYVFIVLLLLSLPSLAQLTIQNERKLDLPRDKAEVVYRTACRVVAEEFHIEPAKAEFPLTLVLGEKNERYTADDEKHTYFVYLNNWNENLFASSTMMLALHRMVPRERQQHMLVQILKRANGQAPVSVSNLGGHK